MQEDRDREDPFLLSFSPSLRQTPILPKFRSVFASSRSNPLEVYLDYQLPLPPGPTPDNLILLVTRVNRDVTTLTPWRAVKLGCDAYPSPPPIRICLPAQWILSSDLISMIDILGPGLFNRKLSFHEG